jgi:propionyl-CoA carboxylase beta chain
MGAKPAVGIINRRELAAAEDRDALRDKLAAAYTESHLGPEVAARDGIIDELVAPSETRARLAWALRSLGSRR